MGHTIDMVKVKKMLTLKQNIVVLTLMGWVIPVLLIALMLETFVDERSTRQAKETVCSSMEKAVDLYEIELASCETASKNLSYYSNVREVYLRSLETNDSRELRDVTNSFLNSEYKYNRVSKAAMVKFVDGSIYYTYNNSTGADYKNIASYVNFGSVVVDNASRKIGTGTCIVSAAGRNYLVRNLVLPNYEPYATLAIEMNEQSFLKGFQTVWGYENVMILNDGIYMMGNRAIERDPNYEYMMQALSQQKGKEAEYFETFKDYSYVAMRWQDYGKEMVAIMRLDNKVINQNHYATWSIFGVMVCFIAPLMLSFFKFFKNKVLKPMNSMVYGYERLAEQDYGYQITDMSKTKEFHYVQESFNQMSNQIKEQFEKIYREEIALRDARIMALQSQINPHFLNNTFEIINWEARLNGNIKVSKMIEALSTMLEATMNRRGQQMHSLAEEMSYVDAYAYIISERLGDKFSYKKEIAEDVMSVQVPKLIIQPIVENAVEHGIGEVGRGDIKLMLFLEGEYVRIEIWNDGRLTEESERKIHHILEEEIDPNVERSLSLGIRNVNNRLKLIYGEDCGLTIESRENYTVSTILLKLVPLVEQ